MAFRIIIGHSWKNGIFHFESRYVDPITGEYTLTVPFLELKEDQPIACAKYIKEYITESSRRRSGRSPLNEWANSVLGINQKITFSPVQHNLNQKLTRRHSRHPNVGIKYPSAKHRFPSGKIEQKTKKTKKKKITAINSCNRNNGMTMGDVQVEDGMEGENNISSISTIILLRQGCVPDFWI